MAETPPKPSPFGTGLLLVDGDLVLDAGDLRTVTGRPNFLQAVQVIIETPFGSDVFNVRYGFDVAGVFTTAQSVTLVKELIRLNIIKSVSQDDRVRQIKDVVFDDDPQFYEIFPDQVRAEHDRARQTARRWQAVVVLQAVAEGEVALRLEGAGLNA